MLRRCILCEKEFQENDVNEKGLCSTCAEGVTKARMLHDAAVMDADDRIENQKREYRLKWRRR